MLNDVVLSSYLTKRVDAQRGNYWNLNDDFVVEGWIKSLIKLGLHGIIFHDGLSLDFIHKWEPIEFIFIEWRTKFTPCEERFEQYAQFLAGRTDITRILMTDIQDVEFFQNPFTLMIDSNTIYCGSELDMIGNNGWIMNQMFDSYGEITTPDKQLLNTGILGGHRDIVCSLLENLNAEITRGVGNPYHDMPAFNRVIYQKNYKYETGFPLHTRFKEFESSLSGASIRHK
jgi:hypothetical protein